MKRLFIVLCPVVLAMLALAFTASRGSAGISLKDNCRLLKSGDRGFIQLVANSEPGEPLVIYGRVVDHKTWRSVRDVSLFLYQVNAKGEYNSPGPDDQARIRGTVNTSLDGCFKIKTILPGDYPGQKNSRHLHYVINAKGYKETRSILFFKGFTTISDQGNLAVLDIKKDSTGVWVGVVNFFMETDK
jgi:protocatechuate 3,4-dioxygenase beta subunit